MALDQHAANLVDTTINAFNGDATSISPTDGISLIDGWISALRTGGQETNPVASGLDELKTELQSGNPDGSRIQQIIDDLADQAKQAAVSADADVQTKLNPLVSALQGFSQQLGGSSSMASFNTNPSDTVMPGQSGEQAPMTSTVGGESTNSGTGTSAMDGTTENGSPVGMDDMTGSDGAQRQDGGSYGSGYGTGSGGDDYSANSGTQSSGVSRGSAESGGGSSGGRSQY